MEEITAKIVSWLHQTISAKFFQAGKGRNQVGRFGERKLGMSLGLNQSYRGREERTVELSYSKRQKSLGGIWAGALPSANTDIFTHPNKPLLPGTAASSVGSEGKLGCELL